MCTLFVYLCVLHLTLTVPHTKCSHTRVPRLACTHMHTLTHTHTHTHRWVLPTTWLQSCSLAQAMGLRWIGGRWAPYCMSLSQVGNV